MSFTLAVPSASGSTKLMASFAPPAIASEAQRLALWVIGFLLALMPPTVLACLMETRRLNDINLWIKPLHFELSLLVHFATLLALMPLMTAAALNGRRLRWAMRAASLAMIAEMAWLLTEAARGRPSHFNQDTVLEAVIYPVMGGFAVLLLVAAVAVALGIRQAPAPSLAPGLRGGAVWGLSLGALATLIVASVLSSGVIDGPGHWVGGIRSDAGGLPLVGWSTTGGDLRVAHFFATHMMQGLPVIGWLVDRLAPAYARATVYIAAAAWLSLVAATFAQALAGRPLLAGF